LAFSTGNFGRFACSQVRDAKRFENRSRSPLALLSRQPSQSVFDVLFGRHVREQGQILQDVADPSLFDRHLNAPFGVEENCAADGDPSNVRLGQAGDRIEQSSLPRPGRAEQDAEPRSQG